MRKCEFCGKELPKNNDRFCSYECHYESRVVEQPQHTCVLCGDTFRRRIGNGDCLYCSPKCRAIGSGIKRRKSIDKEYTCKWCSKKFTKHVSKSTDKYQYCSKSCANYHRYDKIRKSRQQGDDNNGDMQTM